ncbi:MAG TPA: ferric citrate ABC transporter ATP-binding protein FecE, partial [Clostridiales bacterium]|nr:ferric citrate ABC transporter ATP-binding protein FecE [Clostridiales bacterium]
MNLEVKDLTVSFGNRKVLDGISAEFSEGKITCLIGPNGCGKTT